MRNFNRLAIFETGSSNFDSITSLSASVTVADRQCRTGAAGLRLQDGAGAGASTGASTGGSNGNSNSNQQSEDDWEIRGVMPITLTPVSN